MATSRGKKSVEKFFDLYSRNLSEVKQHPGVHIEPDVDEVFLCPLCYRLWEREAISAESITLEHVPPKSLGGKVRTITCKDCNNWAGTKLDSQLGQKLEFSAFISGVPGSTAEARYSLNDQVDSLPATIRRPNPNTWEIIGDPKRSNPNEIRKLDYFKEINSFNITFRPYKRNYPEASLMRTAYLWLFSVFGYSFLLNSNLSVIRQQIRNPEQSLLPNWGIVNNKDLPNELLGVNVIRKPIELLSFFVVFDVTNSTGLRERIGVLLPRPSDTGLNIYHYLENQKGKSFPMKSDHFPDQSIFINYPLEALTMWDIFAEGV